MALPYDPQKFFDLADIGSDARRGDAARGAGIGGLDYLQLGLAGLGFTPGPVGIGADLLDAGISAARGDWLGTGLGLGAAIPGIGMGFSGRHAGKLLGQGAQSMDEARSARKALGFAEEQPLSFGGQHQDEALRAFNRMSPEEQARHLTPEHRLGMEDADPRPDRQAGYQVSPESKLLNDINDPFMLRGAVTHEEKIAAIQEYVEEAGGTLAHESLFASRSNVELAKIGMLHVSDAKFRILNDWRFNTAKRPLSQEIKITGEVPRVSLEAEEITRGTSTTGYGHTPETRLVEGGGGQSVKEGHAVAKEQERIASGIAEGSAAAKRDIVETRSGQSRMRSDQQTLMAESGLTVPTSRGISEAQQGGYRVGTDLESDPIWDRFDIPGHGIKPIVIHGEEKITKGVAERLGEVLEEGKPRISKKTRSLSLGKAAQRYETPRDVMLDEMENPNRHLSEFADGPGRSKLYEQQHDPRVRDMGEAVDDIVEREGQEAADEILEYGGSSGHGDVVKVKGESGGEMLVEVWDSVSKEGNTTLTVRRVLGYQDYLDVVDHGLFSSEKQSRMFGFEKSYKKVRRELENWGDLQRTNLDSNEKSYLLPPVIAKMLRRQGDGDISTLFQGLDYKELQAVSESIINSERVVFADAKQALDPSMALLSVRQVMSNFNVTQASSLTTKDMIAKLAMAKKTLSAIAPHLATKQLVFNSIGNLPPQKIMLWGTELDVVAGVKIDNLLKETIASSVLEVVGKSNLSVRPDLIDGRFYEIFMNSGVSKDEMPTAIAAAKKALSDLTGNPKILPERIQEVTEELLGKIDAKTGKADTPPTDLQGLYRSLGKAPGAKLRGMPSKERTLPKKK